MKSKRGKKDIVLPGQPLPSGEIPLLKIREDGTPESASLFCPLEEGTPLPPSGDLTELHPIPGTPLAELVHTGSYGKKSKKVPHKGPPRVSTRAYREGWDRVFGVASGLDVVN